MVKDRKITKEILYFNRKVKATELNMIAKEFNVIIVEKLVIDDNLNIECNLYVLGDVVRKSPFSDYEIKINGDFFCCGEIHCNNIKIMGDFISEGIIYSHNISVGEDFICYDKVNAYGYNVSVAGNIEAFSLKADSIMVLNSIVVYETISAREISTGY